MLICGGTSVMSLKHKRMVFRPGYGPTVVVFILIITRTSLSGYKISSYSVVRYSVVWCIYGRWRCSMLCYCTLYGSHHRYICTKNIKHKKYTKPLSPLLKKGILLPFLLKGDKGQWSMINLCISVLA